jgi:hypothetical protein
MYNPSGQILFVDSFSHYNSAIVGGNLVGDVTRKWTSGGGPLVPGRTLMGMNIGNASVELTLPSDYSTLCAGLAYKTWGFANNILAFSNGQFWGANAALQHVGNGRLQAVVTLPYAGSFTAPVRNFVMSLGIWYYIEFQAAVVSPTQIAWAVQVNEKLVDSGTIQVTFSGWGNPGGFTPGNFCMASATGSGAGYPTWICDFYLSDGAFFGDVSFKVIYPRADVAISGWQPNPNDGVCYNKVNEHAPDYDATTIDSGTVGDSALFDMDPVGDIGDIAAIQLLNLCTKTQAGTAIAQPKYIVPPNSPSVGAPMYPSALDWFYIREVLTRNPWTGQRWTWQDIDALQVEIARIG